MTMAATSVQVTLLRSPPTRKVKLTLNLMLRLRLWLRLEPTNLRLKRLLEVSAGQQQARLPAHVSAQRCLPL